MPRRSHLKRRGISRRQLLKRLATFGAAGGLVGLGGAGAVWLRNRPRVVVLPNDNEVAGMASTTDGLTIVGRDDWGALPVDISARNEGGYYEKDSNPQGRYVYGGDLRESYQTLVIHHSAFYKANGLATVLEVQRLHRNDRGWADVGYHFMVDGTGKIYEGRSLAVRGVHTAGHNTGSAGVCLLGDFRTRPPSTIQWDASIKLSRWLVSELQLTHLAGHSQFNVGTECPGAAVLKQLADLAELVGVEYGTDGYVPTASADADCGCCSCGTPL